MKKEILEDKLDKIVSKEQSKFWAESDERFKNKETLEVIWKEIIEYCKDYEGTDKYNAVILAIEFGFQLALKQK